MNCLLQPTSSISIAKYFSSQVEQEKPEHWRTDLAKTKKMAVTTSKAVGPKGWFEIPQRQSQIQTNHPSTHKVQQPTTALIHQLPCESHQLVTRTPIYLLSLPLLSLCMSSCCSLRPHSLAQNHHANRYPGVGKEVSLMERNHPLGNLL